MSMKPLVFDVLVLLLLHQRICSKQKWNLHSKSIQWWKSEL